MKTYVDLNLPSGTLWAEKNEEDYYTFDEAVEKYGNSLPTREQLEELKEYCQWKWIDDGYKVTGPNGESIVLPAEGHRSCSGCVNNVGSSGYYWSSIPRYDLAWYLNFNYDTVNVYGSGQFHHFSVRLVK